MDTRTLQAVPARAPERGRTCPIPMRAGADGERDLAAVFAVEEGPLLRYGFGLVGRREVAEDLVQDAFLKLHEHWGEVTNPRAWLFRCVRNLALNHLRDHRREVDEEAGRGAVARTPAPDAAVGRMEAAGTLRLLVAELPDEDRRLIAMKYEEDLKYRQISERTGMSIGNVGYRLHHALKGLAEGLRRAGIDGVGG